MVISRGKAVRKATPEGRSEQEGGLGSPDRVARSAEVAKADRQLTRHRRGSRRGLSEYKRNFKWRSPEFCSPSQQQKSLWAGLRSDQFGITKEPKFISKRRVPYHNPQISKSLEWPGDCDLNDQLKTEAAELHTDHDNDNGNQEKLETPEGPQLPPKVQSHVVDSGGEIALALAENNMKKSPSEAPPNQNIAFSSPKKESEKMGNGFHKALQRKADINIPRNSEYQSQFVWKSLQEKSPILAAEQLICNTKKSIPPVKPPAITSETAFERNSKGSPPVKSPQERDGSAEKEFLSKREEPFQKPAEDATKQGKSEQKHPKQNNKQHISPKPLTLHTSRGKMNTEYRSKFLSPAQYFYKDGVWSRIKSKAHNQVRELRERAKAYRQRVEGTHFSRYHFNQILSDNNSLWDVSSTSSSEEGISNNIRALDLAGVSEKEAAGSSEVLQQPDSREQALQDSTKKDMSDALTVPVKRRLVWDKQEGTEEREDQQSTEEKEEEKSDEQAAVMAQQLEENNKDAKEDKKTEGESALVLNTSAAVSDSSVSSRRGSKHPTLKLRALAGTPRAHHNRATPAVGGTVLASAPKFKSSSSPQRKQNLATNPTKKESFQPDVKMEATLLFNSAPAGLGTVDPLPLRQDQWPPNRVADEQVPHASAHQEQSKSAKSCSVPCWSPSHRIQGTLKDPEFQHNGNLGNPKVRTFQLPLRERNRNDEDDRLSQISARSAASSSLASQILERAQKRKDFWGKA
ncbi:nuclear protein MDM1 isoform X2 [Haemorhous mexicanus]|uniref:nuclear protein MDM1 isoform X2 n=1 Tax=Haemorhous mexicanus TaxID=30427 RepID=UPI0028BD4662|nr:nuclear protein MDM1 isoform X2 [Haemorhous mexicanus]